MKALNSNGSMGVSYTSSFLMTLFFNRLKFRDYGGLLQGESNEQFSFFANLTSLEMRQGGIGFGYGWLIPIGPLYFGLGGLVGGGYQDNRREDLNGVRTNDQGFGSHWAVKTTLASHGPGLNFGLKGFLFSNIYQVADSNNAASLNYNIYFYGSYTW